MKTLSLWQPWASLVAVGAKRIETRCWETKHRGPLAIHAAQRCNVSELIFYSSCWNWCGALRPLGVGMGDHKALDKVLPFGKIIAVCNLVDCRPTGSFTVEELDTPRRPEGEKLDVYTWTERQFGDYSLGRFGWVLEDVQALKEPIPAKGFQRLFNVDDELFGSELLSSLNNAEVTRADSH